MWHGRLAGQPTVQIKLSTSSTNAAEVGSLDRMLAGWGWKRKIRSGYARLRLKGVEPLDDMHREGLEAFDTLLDPMFVDVELNQRSISRVPSRFLRNMTDSWTLFVPLDQSYDDDAMEFFSEKSRNYGDVEFLFKIKEWDDDERVRDIVKKWNLYDSDVWLYPVGERVDTAVENVERCHKWSKKRKWNVSPRYDLWQQYAEEDE